MPETTNTDLKDQLLGGRVTITELAKALGYRSLRPVHRIISELSVPVVIIDRLPHVRPSDFRDALEQKVTSTAPRGRGRPRKRVAA